MYSYCTLIRKGGSVHILVVLHFSPQFEQETVQFYEYFKNHLKLSRKESHFFNATACLDGIKLEDMLAKVSKINEPLVIYYGGHGYRNGWQLGENHQISYKWLVARLKKRKRPTIFVNDCCFAMALQDHLHKLRCRYLLLGLAPKTLEGFESIVPALLDCWKNRRTADPKLWVWNRQRLSPFILKKSGDRLRSGAKLDYLCYPKKILSRT